MLTLQNPYLAGTKSEVLADIAARFVLNCPSEDLESHVRLLFQIEEAHWFYEDFVRLENRALPATKLRAFVCLLFNACPVLYDYCKDPEEAVNTFRSYKNSIPVRGGIILNENLDKVLLVRGWCSSNWSFPGGKINKQEKDVDCAVREVLEETGFDMSPYVDENEYLEATRKGKHTRLYIVRGVPEDTVFETHTRKEIGTIQWRKLKTLPVFNPRANDLSRLFMARPFLPGLYEYVERVKRGKTNGETNGEVEEVEVEEVEVNEGAEILKLLKGTRAEEPEPKVLEKESKALLSMIQPPEKHAPVPPPEKHAPPVPPNSMLQTLLSSRREYASTSLLSALEKPETKDSSFLLNLLHAKPDIDPNQSTVHRADMIAPTIAPSTRLLEMLAPKSEQSPSPNLLSLLSGRRTEPVSEPVTATSHEMSMPSGKIQRRTVASNMLLDLLAKPEEAKDLPEAEAKDQPEEAKTKPDLLSLLAQHKKPQPIQKQTNPGNPTSSSNSMPTKPTKPTKPIKPIKPTTKPPSQPPSQPPTKSNLTNPVTQPTTQPSKNESSLLALLNVTQGTSRDIGKLRGSHIGNQVDQPPRNEGFEALKSLYQRREAKVPQKQPQTTKNIQNTYEYPDEDELLKFLTK